MAKKSAKKRGRRSASGANGSAGVAGSAGSAASAGSLSSISTQELAREVKRRERQLSQLHNKREGLMRRLGDVDAEIRALGSLVGGSANGAGGGRRRARNESNLADALHAVLNGVTMSVTEAAEAVQQAGYVTTAENFRTIVNQTLLREKNKFKKIARGQYTAK